MATNSTSPPRTRSQGPDPGLALDDFEEDTLRFIAFNLGVKMTDVPFDYTYRELKERIRKIERAEKTLADQDTKTIQAMLRARNLSDYGNRGELITRCHGSYLGTINDAIDMDIDEKNAIIASGGSILPPDGGTCRVPEDQMCNFPQIQGYYGLDTPGRLNGEMIFPSAGDYIRHDPPTRYYRPDYIESLFFPGLQPAKPNYLTRWYVIAEDCNNEKAVKIALVHPDTEEKEDGLEEEPGQFDHSQFRYDREWDFPRGVSTDRWGGRTGKIPKSPEALPSRVRIGVIDKSWFPLDSVVIQEEVTKWINKQRNKTARQAGLKTKKRKRNNDNAAAPDGHDPRVLPDGCPVKFSVTDTKRLAQNTAYNLFIQEFHYFIRQDPNNYHQRAAAPTPEEWYPIIIKVIENTNILPYQVKQDLLFGAYERVVEPDTELNVQTDAQNLAQWVFDIEDWIKAGDSTAPFPDKPPAADFETISDRELPYAQALWNQRRRFLWPAVERIAEIALAGCKEMEKTMEQYDQAKADYCDYWADEGVVKGLPQPPHHPHPIDPVPDPSKAAPKATGGADGVQSEE